MNSIDNSIAAAGITKAGCPSDETLREVLSDTTTVDSAIAQHIESCEQCQQRLAMWSGSNSLDAIHDLVADHVIAEELDPPLREGDLGAISGWAIESKIGQGGMGVVFRAHDIELDRDVAVKLLRTDASSASFARFEREAKAAAKLTHPNTVPVYQFGRRSTGRPYIVMPLVTGDSLKSRLKRSKPLPPCEAAEWVRQTAMGLAAAHEEGLIHRDVKPANILLDKELGEARLTDFGLVRNENDQTLTRAHAICGTPTYMSPEQIQNAASTDKRGDVYSLGIVLYECLTGDAPFRGMPMEILDQHRNDEPIPPKRLNASIPVPLQTICLKAISKEPDRRYQSSHEFAADLQRFLKDQPILAKEASPFVKFQLWTKRNRVVASWGGFSILLLLLLAIVSTTAALGLNRANRDIVSESERAATAEQLAIQDRTAAVDALERLVDSLYEDLSQNAATIKTREKVVSASMDGLKSLTKLPSDQRADRTIYRALLRMGDLSTLRAEPRAAEQYYRDAIDVAEMLLSVEPENEVFLNDQCLANLKLTQQYFSNQNQKLDAAVDKTSQMLDAVISRYPESEIARRNLLALEVLKLEVLRQRNPQDPQRVLDQAGSIEENLQQIGLATQPDLSHIQTAQKFYFLVGRAWLESHNPAKANAYFQLSEAKIEHLLSIAPENLSYQMAAASLYRAQGMTIGALGRLSEATPYLERAVELMDRICIVDAENQMMRMNLANTQTILAMARQFSGDLKAAIDLRLRSANYFEQFLQTHPENHPSRVQLNFNRLEIIGLLLNDGDYSAALEMVETIERDLEIEEFAESGMPAVGMLATQFQLSKEIMGHVLSRPLDNVSDRGKCSAAAILLREFAKTARGAKLPLKLSQQLQAIDSEFDQDTIAQFFEFCLRKRSEWEEGVATLELANARIHGILAANIASLKDEDLSGELDDAIKRSIDSIEQFATLLPDRVTDVVMNEADLIWLREQPEFEATWSKLQTNSAK